MKILIADSGSTKTDWALVDEQGNVMVTCKTQGISPIHQSDAEILDVLCKELVLSEQPQQVFFYGSGVTEAMKSRMKSLLQQSFPEAKVEAEGDMLGAARALFGKKPGIACILGTGANSCLYDGEKIVMNTPPLGYILGDEGSGAVIGKLFLNSIFKGTLPVSLKNKYLAWSGLDYPTIINKVYRQPLANRFLASICPFISEQIAEGEKHENGTDELNEAMALYRMILESFNQFYAKNLTPYIKYVKASTEDISQLEPGMKAWHSSLEEEIPMLGFVGSIAHYFESPLRNVMEDEFHLKISQILKAPMPGQLLRRQIQFLHPDLPVPIVPYSIGIRSGSAIIAPAILIKKQAGINPGCFFSQITGI